MVDESKYTITEHLDELRGRLIKGILGILATTVVALFFSPQLLDYAVEPLLEILRDRTKIEAVVVHTDETRATGLVERLESRARMRVHPPLTSLDDLRETIDDAASAKRPIDLVLVASSALGEDGALATDVLDGIEPAPYVTYLVADPKSPLVTELMLEGASVIPDPPREAVLGRIVRRAAGAAGKAAAGDKLVVLSPLEPFFAFLKISVVVGLFLACPIWLFQAWRFIEPGLFAHERRLVLPVILSGSLLFVGGGLFAYFGMFPVMFDFLVNQMMPGTLASAFTVDKYLSLLLRITVAFGVVFELPLAIAMMAMVGIVTPEKLRAWRKYFLIVSFVLGAMLTPADPLSQIMMAGPLILFYELGIVLASMIGRSSDARDSDETAVTTSG